MLIFMFIIYSDITLIVILSSENSSENFNISAMNRGFRDTVISLDNIEIE